MEIAGWILLALVLTWVVVLQAVPMLLAALNFLKKPPQAAEPEATEASRLRAELADLAARHGLRRSGDPSTPR